MKLRINEDTNNTSIMIANKAINALKHGYFVRINATESHDPAIFKFGFDGDIYCGAPELGFYERKDLNLDKLKEHFINMINQGFTLSKIDIYKCNATDII